MTTPNVPEHNKPLLELLLGVGSVAGLVLSVIGLNVDRLWRTVGSVLLVLAATAGFMAIATLRFRRPALIGSAGLLAAAVAVLSLAPAPQAPASAPESLVISATDVTDPAPDHPATLDVSLRNPGHSRVALTEADLTVVDFAYVPVCEWGSNTEISATYDLRMPDRPTPGTVLTRTLHQQIGPDEIDRFTLGLAAPVRAQQKGGAPEELAIYLYRVRLSVKTDDGRPPVDLGEFVVSAKNALQVGSYYFGEPRPATLADAHGGLCGDDLPCQRTTVACWNSNRTSLLRLLGGKAARSETATAALHSVAP